MCVSLHVSLVISLKCLAFPLRPILFHLEFPMSLQEMFQMHCCLFLIIFQREKGLVSFSYVLLRLSCWVPPICRIGGVLRQDLLSLCPHPLSLYYAPKAPGVFIEQCLPPSLATAAQKNHWKHFSILMRQFFEDLCWLRTLPTLSWGDLFILCEMSFPSFTCSFIFFRWNTVKFLFLFVFHILRFLSRVRSSRLTWKAQVLLRFI